MFGVAPKTRAIAYVSQMRANAARKCNHNPIQSEAIHEKVLVRRLLEILLTIADRKKLKASNETTISSVNLTVQFVMLKNRTAVKNRR